MKKSKARKFLRRIHETINGGISYFVLLALVFNLGLISNSFAADILYTLLVIVVTTSINWIVFLFVASSGSTKQDTELEAKCCKSSKKKTVPEKKQTAENQAPIQEEQAQSQVSKKDSSGVSRLFEMLSQIKSPEDNENLSVSPTEPEIINDLQEDNTSCNTLVDAPES